MIYVFINIEFVNMDFLLCANLAIYSCLLNIFAYKALNTYKEFC